MTSRYSYMEPSKACDIDKDCWPDPLSIRYTNPSMNVVPATKEVNTSDLQKFWLTYYNTYGATDGDDILLSYNGVPYIGMLEPGDSIVILDSKDVSQSRMNLKNDFE